MSKQNIMKYLKEQFGIPVYSSVENNTDCFGGRKLICRIAKIAAIN